MPRTEATFTLAPGAGFVLYTDDGTRHELGVSTRDRVTLRQAVAARVGLGSTD